LEFKSSLRWGVPEGGVNKTLEKVIVKTIAGFLNSKDGGTLLIGVADNGTILGLEGDYGSSPSIAAMASNSASTSC
jgi:predicted HTH transcriptional regulator